MQARIISIIAVSAALAACGGTPASIEDVEEKLTEDFSDGEAEVTWVSAIEDEPGQFTATIDITEPEEETGSRTATCSVSQTSMSFSRSCQSMRPSLGVRMEREIEGYYGSRNVPVHEITLEREDDGNFVGFARVTDPATGREVRLNCTATNDTADESTGWRCDEPS